MTPIRSFIQASQKINPQQRVILPSNISAREHGYDVQIDNVKYHILRMHRDEAQIELRNYLQEPGWLYRRADYIVFEIDKGYLVIDRSVLVRIVEGLINSHSGSSIDSHITIHKDDIKDMITKLIYK